ncbi:lymphotactin-like [Pezoporus flaviventris]|uniref:lymphotactin-like n=1 Tax=Pezoporus flaviventris TaxID=889875 RepID=UPI002AB13C4E|nr:lymphotactin-like [Pezoporus flaviventris]
MTTYKLCERGLTVATFFPAVTKKTPAMKLQTAAILLVFWLGMLAVHEVKGSAGSQPMRRFSCVRLSTRQLNIRNLASYEKQQVPVNATLFITTKGIKICVNSNQKWVQTAMKKIDQKRAIKDK